MVFTEGGGGGAEQKGSSKKKKNSFTERSVSPFLKNDFYKKDPRGKQV